MKRALSNVCSAGEVTNADAAGVSLPWTSENFSKRLEADVFFKIVSFLMKNQLNLQKRRKK
jgi:hypothetical protein